MAGHARESVRRRPKVLLVEDNRLIRNYIAFILGADGYTVVETGSVKAAFKALSDDLSFALVDFQLGDGNGFEVATELAEKVPTCRVAIMSALPLRVLRERSRDYPVNPPLVEKPHDPAEFPRILEKVGLELPGTSR